MQFCNIHLWILNRQQLEREEAIVNMLRGWMLHLGPMTSRELSDALNLM